VTLRVGVTLARVQRIALPTVNIRIAGRRGSCETLLAHASAFQLTLSTALPDEGVQLHSSYLGHDRAERSAASHLLVAPGTSPRVWSVDHDPASLPVMYERRQCLLDHLAALAGEFRHRSAEEVLVDVPAEALERLDQV
jgi:hypothetical protein